MQQIESMLNVQTFEFNPFQENTYVLFDETKECVIIDPGCFVDQERKELADFIEAQDLSVKMLLNTHCHIDHVLGNYFVKEKYKTTDSLNKVWGLNYWGMRLNGWDEFPTRKSATNPSYKLEWDRFGQKVPEDFLTWPSHIVSE